MEATLVYPNQLFQFNPAISRNRKIYLVEDPLFFGDVKYAMNFHKKKILLHRFSMDHYMDSLIKKKYTVHLIDYKNLLINDYTYWFIKKYNISALHIVDVVNKELMKRVDLAAKKSKIHITWYDNPSFLLDRSIIKDDFENKSFHFMSTFYKKQRKRFGILLDENAKPFGGKWSFDDMNRKKLPKKINIPKVSLVAYDESKLKHSANFVERNFKQNYGALENFNYSVHSKQAQVSMMEFFEKKFTLFGPYEDAISREHNELFHSVLSPSLNIGLITPKQVLEESLLYAKEYSVPINSLEGFIRQILGWREFIRGVYVVDGSKQRSKNFWNFNKIIPESFYSGKTGIEPVDVTIKKVMENAYLHHIERLMIMGNIFILLRISPDSVYKWFMELFIDAYDWVMVPNVYGMSQFADGGLMSTKPYISGSNYIIKMSNYKKGSWARIWDALYWEYINDHRLFFKKNPRMSMMISLYDKKTGKEKLLFKSIRDSIQL